MMDCVHVDYYMMFIYEFFLYFRRQLSNKNRCINNQNTREQLKGMSQDLTLNLTALNIMIPKKNMSLTARKNVLWYFPSSPNFKDIYGCCGYFPPTAFHKITTFNQKMYH